MKLKDNLFSYPWMNMMENNCNSYYLGGDIPTLIDTGHKHRVSDLLSQIKSDGIDPKGIELIITTHAHPDHFEGNQLFDRNGVMVAMHKQEEIFINEMGESFSRMLGMKMPDMKIDFYLKEGDLKLGKNELEIYHTPGHSPGSISVYWPEKKALITGDVVFNQGVGRTDFPGCSGKLLKESIERLSRLDVEYLLPGHGDIISCRDEVRLNFDSIKRSIFPYI